jgi:hypothetical protein
MFHVKHFGTIGAQNLIRHQTMAPPSTCKIDQSFGAIAEVRRRRLDGLADLPEVTPDVRFAERIEVVARDARAAATWSRRSPAFDNTPAANGGMFLHRNCGPRKPCNINGLILCRSLDFLHGTGRLPAQSGDLSAGSRRCSIAKWL